MKRPARAAWRWIAGTALGLIAILLVALAFMDWNLLKHPLERAASTRFGRIVRIEGDLKVHLWSWTPTVTFNGLSVGNPPWEANRPMLQVERVKIRLKLLPLLKGDVILAQVELNRPNVYLHQERSGRANWTFESQAPTNARASGPTRLPAIQDFLIEEGKLTLLDDLRKLKVDGTIQAHEKGSADDPKAFRVEGRGTINDQPFEMHLAGGPLVHLDPEHPYPFSLEIAAGEIHVASDGRVLKPFDLAGLDFEVTLSGNDLGELFYLTQLALPNTPPFRLHAHIARQGMKVAVTDIAGKLGRSDLSGKLAVDATRKRPSLTGDVVSEQLRLSDLAASLGAKSKGPESLDAKTSGNPSPSQPKQKKPPPDPNARLFPTAHLQVDRVRAMDADVHFRAKSIEAGSVPLKQVALHVKLEEGVLSLDPFAVDLPQGHLRGNARIDARTKTPKVRIDARLKDIQLDQLKGKAPDSKPALGGVMQARAVIEGTGDSVHAVMSDANGTVTTILPHGEVRAAFAELTGINVARGVGLLLKGDNDRAEIRCGVAQFDVHDGVMLARMVDFDTQDVRITGRGQVRLGPEELDLSIKGDPKRLRLARLRTPVEIRGHLLDPSVGVDAGSTLKQGAIAAALGTALTPIAAIIAFVDPGLAKDENCAALLETAQSHAAAVSAPATPSAAPRDPFRTATTR